MRFSTLAASAAFLIPFTASAVGVQVMIDGQVVIFSDVSQSAWFASYVQQSAEAGIVTGYEDTSGKLTGKFGPSNTITVAESLKIASEGAGYDEAAYASKVSSGVDHWASAYVSVAKSEEFPVVGRGGNIDRAATRAEVAAFLAAAFQLQTDGVELGSRYTDVKSTTEFAYSVEVLSRDGILSGDTDVTGKATGTFRPTQPINRAEVAKMIMKARDVYGTPGKGRLPDETDGSTQTEVNVVTYTDAGFTPKILRIKKGESVKFRNNSSLKMWVASDDHPWHTDLAGFDALRGFLAGETYIYTFNRIGSWGYHNHSQSTDTATIVVE